MPIVLLLILVVLVFAAKPAQAAGPTGAAGGFGGANQAPPAPARTLGPSTGKPQNWIPPTDIVIENLQPVAPGENKYGGNEADPRIAGGTWYDPKTQSRCTYDRVKMSTSCVTDQDPCTPGGWQLAVFQAAGLCPRDLTPPPPPPPPPANTIVGPPPPPPPGATQYGTTASRPTPRGAAAETMTGAGHF